MKTDVEADCFHIPFSAKHNQNVCISSREGVIGQKTRLLIRGSALGCIFEPTHIEKEMKIQEDEVGDEREKEECKAKIKERPDKHSSA